MAKKDNFLELKVDSTAVRRLLDGLSKRLRNMSPAMAAISEEMKHGVLENFDTEGKSLGKQWEKLKGKTIEQREKDGWTPITILKAEGKLKGSVSAHHTADTATVGTANPYARAHHFGLSKLYS